MLVSNYFIKEELLKPKHLVIQKDIVSINPKDCSMA